MSTTIAPSLAWTRFQESSLGRAVTIASDGYVYVAGTTDGNFNGNSGTVDCFISKYGVDGSKIWTRFLGTSSTDEAWALTTGKDGAVYVAGRTGGDLDGQISKGSYDAFISKYDAEGSKIWTRLWGLKSFDRAYSLATGIDGTIYMAGEADGAPTQAFLTKYTPDGAEVWTRALGSTYGRAVTVGNDGSIYMAGQTGVSLDGQRYTNAGDIFVARYDSDGLLTWARLLGTNEGESALAVATGSDGSVYVAGYTYGSPDRQTNNGGKDGFLAKYSPDGTKQWTRLVGGIKEDFVTDVSIGTDEVIYVSGVTYGDIDDQKNNGGTDAFLAAFNPDGSRAWTRLIGTSVDQEANSIATGLDGEIYMAGRSMGGFDAQAGSGGAFLAKWIVPIDTTPPKIALSASESALKGGETAMITFTLTEGSVNFRSEDVDVSGGSISQLEGAGMNYLGTFTPYPNSTLSASIRVTSGKLSDMAGNVNADGDEANNTLTLSVDTAAPKVVVSSERSTLKVGDTADITFSFSEEISDFSLADVSVKGGSLSNLRGTGSHRVATFTLDANVGDPVVLSIPSGVFKDSIGNLNADGADSDNLFRLKAQISGQILAWGSETPVVGAAASVYKASILPEALAGVGYVATSGDWQVDGIDFQSYSIKCTKPVRDIDQAAITAADVLAALKISVGRNPNSDPDGPGAASRPDLSPYQLIAADINGDQRITVDDPLALLKASVTATSIASRWSFLDASIDMNDLSRTMVKYDSTVYLSASADTRLNLIGVLVGDLDGSWAAPLSSADYY